MFIYLPTIFSIIYLFKQNNIVYSYLHLPTVLSLLPTMIFLPGKTIRSTFSLKTFDILFLKLNYLPTYNIITGIEIKNNIFISNN